MSNARSIGKLAPLAAYVTSIISLVTAPPSPASSIPTGTVLDFAGPESAIPSGYLACDGRAVSRSANATLFAVIGTTHGPGDGSTTFNLPDSRGRVSAGNDAMGGVAANRLTASGAGINGATLGATGGVEAVTLTGSQSGLPAHGHTASSTHSLSTAAAGSHSHTVNGWMQFGGSHAILSDGGQDPGPVTTDTAPNHTHTITGSISTTVNSVAAANASQAHSNTQPTIIFNKIIKT